LEFGVPNGWSGTARSSSKAIARIKALDDLLLTRNGYEFGTLWWNLRSVSGHLRNNANTLVHPVIEGVCRSEAALPSPR
jgi:hypothetical protein